MVIGHLFAADSRMFPFSSKRKNGWTNSEIIQFALGLWTNYIETGNISLSAQDAQDQGSKFNALSNRANEIDRANKNFAGRYPEEEN